MGVFRCEIDQLTKPSWASWRLRCINYKCTNHFKSNKRRATNRINFSHSITIEEVTSQNENTTQQFIWKISKKNSETKVFNVLHSSPNDVRMGWCTSIIIWIILYNFIIHRWQRIRFTIGGEKVNSCMVLVVFVAWELWSR